MKFNISLYLSVVARTSANFNIAGVTFALISGSNGQAISGFAVSPQAMHTATVASNSGALNISHASFNTDEYLISGDVRLASKPTWAY